MENEEVVGMTHRFLASGTGWTVVSFIRRRGSGPTIRSWIKFGHPIMGLQIIIEAMNTDETI